MFSAANTYATKREILGFSDKLSAGSHRPDRKFVADMSYGLLASGSCLLTDIADQLHEKGRKINTVDRLSQHLADGLSPTIVRNYLRLIKQMTPSEPTVHIDDSDVIKPDAYHFEALGYVRDAPPVQKQNCLCQKLSCNEDLHPEHRQSPYANLLRDSFLCRKGLFLYNKWTPVAELCKRRKGK